MTSMHKHTKKDALVQFRLNSVDKTTIQRAAELRGLDPSVYMRTLILETAKNDIRHSLEDTRMILSADEWDHFMNIMEAPVRLNKHLKKAFADYKKKYG